MRGIVCATPLLSLFCTLGFCILFYPTWGENNTTYCVFPYQTIFLIFSLLLYSGILATNGYLQSGYRLRYDRLSIHGLPLWIGIDFGAFAVFNLFMGFNLSSDILKNCLISKEKGDQPSIGYWSYGLIYPSLFMMLMALIKKIRILSGERVDFIHDP